MANLIVYFSRKGQNYVNGAICDHKKGNTEIVAEFVKKAVGGDLFEVKPQKEYAKNYYDCIEEASAELRANARPKIVGFVDDISKYDTIFVGYPNWWGQAPMCMCTFLEHYDLSGKRIAPFCTNEGSGMGSSAKQLKSVCKGATILDGLSIHGAEAANSFAQVSAWATKIVK